MDEDEIIKLLRDRGFKVSVGASNIRVTHPQIKDFVYYTVRAIDKIDYEDIFKFI